MYSEDDLEAAMAAGALTPEAATAFRDFMARRRQTSPVDEESFRLLTGFNDIFVAIAIVLLLVALGWLGSLTTSPLGGLLVAAASWGLAEYFTRRRRMALPSIVLLFGLVGGAFAMGQQVIRLGGAETLAGTDFVRQTGLRMALAAAVAALAAFAHWRRFKVPVTVAAGAGAVAGTVLALASALAPGLREFFLPLVFLAGIALFCLAMWWDAGDRERKTRRSDVAFWLHLAAAPLIVHPAFSMLGGGELGRAGLAVAIYLGLALVALAVDRRALLVSALFYVLYAMSALFKAAGSLNESFALTALIIGSALLLLSAFWHHARRRVVALLPAGIRARLPAAG